MQRIKRIIVLGFDGLEPRIVERLLEQRRLPNFARLRASGGYARIATTYPAQTPVAWSTFATGLNPGGHGIFDFLRRDPATYLPQLALSRFEQKNPFVPPKAVNGRQGKAVWQSLSEAGIESVILRCPCTFPAEDLRGRMLSGMGVPDLRGSLGMSTFYSTDEQVTAKESESVVRLEPADGGHYTAHLLGPIHPRSRQPVAFPVTIEAKPASREAVLQCDGEPHELVLKQGRWSDWLHVKFKVGVLQSARGMVRFYLVQTEPTLELYASPVNFDPEAPVFPISFPPQYASELQARLGIFYTTGMVEDHGGLNNGRISEAAYLDQCAQVWREREAMLCHELGRLDEGLLFCLFDTPDRVQHMFQRFVEPDHPANENGRPDGFENVVVEQYLACDATLGRVFEQVDEATLLIALSDHGFDSFRRGVHLNTWAFEQGLLALRDGIRPGEEAGDMLRRVDWSRTQIYSLGLGGMYLNLKGRECQGVVEPTEAESLKSKIAEALTGMEDPERGEIAIRSVVPRERVYRGERTAEAPDLLVNFARGYRASWGTALGAVPDGKFEDNVKRWSGDHIVDPSLVPGVLFMNRPFRQEGPRLVDLASTILGALRVPGEPAMEGASLFA